MSTAYEQGYRDGIKEGGERSVDMVAQALEEKRAAEEKVARLEAELKEPRAKAREAYARGLEHGKEQFHSAKRAALDDFILNDLNGFLEPLGYRTMVD